MLYAALSLSTESSLKIGSSFALILSCKASVKAIKSFYVNERFQTLCPVSTRNCFKKESSFAIFIFKNQIVSNHKQLKLLVFCQAEAAGKQETTSQYSFLKIRLCQKVSG